MSRTPLRILAALTLATALTPGATGADLAARLRALDPRALPEEKDQARQPGIIFIQPRLTGSPGPHILRSSSRRPGTRDKLADHAI